MQFGKPTPNDGRLERDGWPSRTNLGKKVETAGKREELHADRVESVSSSAISARPARDSETLFINVNFCEPVSRNWPLRARLASTTTLRCRNRRGAYCTSSMITGDGWRPRKFCGSFSACSASVGRSRETNPYFGNSRSRVEVLPVWRAPVSTTMGRVRTDRCSLGSMSRGIHMCIIYDRIAYFAMPSYNDKSLFVTQCLGKLHSGYVSGTALHMDFNFSSTYSESSIMRSTTCSTGRPAKFFPEASRQQHRKNPMFLRKRSAKRPNP